MNYLGKMINFRGSWGRYMVCVDCGWCFRVKNVCWFGWILEYYIFFSGLNWGY